jgi:hypothetical protein
MASSTGNMENPEPKSNAEVEKSLVAAAEQVLEGVNQLLEAETSKAPAAPAAPAPTPAAPAPAKAPEAPKQSSAPASLRHHRLLRPAPDAPAVQEDFLTQEERTRRRGTRRM